MSSLIIDMWQKDTDDKFCGNSKYLNDVENQIGCQSLCLESITCVGISYTTDYPSSCYLCNDDELTHSFEFAFYRRGMLML